MLPAPCPSLTSFARVRLQKLRTDPLGFPVAPTSRVCAPAGVRPALVGERGEIPYYKWDQLRPRGDY